MPKKKPDLMAALTAKVKAISEGTDKPRASRARAKPLDQALRQAIKGSGLTHYALGQTSGVAPSVIDRFMLPGDDPRHRGITLATAARLAEALGLELRPAT